MDCDCNCENIERNIVVLDSPPQDMEDFAHMPCVDCIDAMGDVPNPQSQFVVLLK